MRWRDNSQKSENYQSARGGFSPHRVKTVLGE